MSERAEGIAGVLGEHTVATIAYTGAEVDGICCASPECTKDGYAIEFPDMDAFAAHQAAVVDAWLAGQEREEWGVRFERDADPTMNNPSGEVTNAQVVNNESSARNAVERNAPISARNRRVVRRLVTEWVEVPRET